MSLQDEISEKFVTLAVRVNKLTYETTRKVIALLLSELKKTADSVVTKKPDNTKTANKKTELRHGRQTLSQLQRHNDGLSSMELKRPNLRLLYNTMKRYNVDFAPVRDGRGRYILFFKGRDADVLTLAFKKYTQSIIKFSHGKPPIQQSLAAAKAVSQALDAGRGKVKNRSRGERAL